LSWELRLESKKLRTDHEPVPLTEVAWPICRSALPLKVFWKRLPDTVRIPPAGPSTGPCSGIDPRSPTPGMPDRPVVGDWGKKLNESETLKIQCRALKPWFAARFQKLEIPCPPSFGRRTPPAKRRLNGRFVLFAVYATSPERAVDPVTSP